jgi:hypothetical protein
MLVHVLHFHMLGHNVHLHMLGLPTKPDTQKPLETYFVVGNRAHMGKILPLLGAEMAD